MNRILLGILLTSLLVGLTPVGQAQEKGDVVTANNTFAFDLYQQALGVEDLAEANIIFSPYSIVQAFGMTVAGAEGQTRQQIRDTFYFPAEGLHPAMAALQADLTGREVPPHPDPDNEAEPPQFTLANALWAQQGFPFYQDYFDLLAEYYGGGLELADFAVHPDAERLRINGWVEDQTNERIQDLLPPGIISSLTRLVLVNAIYFKGSWMTPFETELTAPAPFTLLDGGTVEVPTMTQTEHFLYADTPDYTAVQLPYYGSQFAMLIVMPTDYAAFEADLDAATFAAIRERLSSQNLELFLPRWEYETPLDLKPLLQSLGLTDAFNMNAANFGRMYDQAQADNLYISDALHKAFVGVDEAGTEAAAATAVIITLRGMPPSATPVRLDHPFLYFIYDQQTDTILFMGRVLNPST